MAYVRIPVRIQLLRCIRFRTGSTYHADHAPLADLVGVERQVAVLAFQLGDAFTNFIVPTSGCLLGALAAANWSGELAKFQIKFQAVLVVFASLAVSLALSSDCHNVTVQL